MAGIMASIERTEPRRRPLCESAQVRGGHLQYHHLDAAPRGAPMTMFLVLLAALVGLVLWRVLASASSADAAPHGRMSERWLAEHRASPPA
jgi:hypothetical protein